MRVRLTVMVRRAVRSGVPDDTAWQRSQPGRAGGRGAAGERSGWTRRGGRIGYVAGPMRIGVPKESAAGEHRVALVPEVVGKLKAKGVDVLVQRGAGDAALLPGEAFERAGAQLTDDA